MMFDLNLEPYRKLIDRCFWFGALPVIGGIAMYAVVNHINVLELIGFKAALFTCVPKMILDCQDSSKRAIAKIEKDLAELSEVEFKEFGRNNLHGYGAQVSVIYRQAYNNEKARRQKLKLHKD